MLFIFYIVYIFCILCFIFLFPCKFVSYRFNFNLFARFNVIKTIAFVYQYTVFVFTATRDMYYSTSAL